MILKHSEALVEASERHAAAIWPLMSEDDREQFEPVGGLSVLIRAAGRAERLWCGVVDGEPIFLAGIRDGGYSWMVGTPAIAQHKKFYLRATRRMCDEMQAMHPHLTTIVDTRYHRSIRWLKWLGWIVGVPFEAGGLTLVSAERTRS